MRSPCPLQKGHDRSVFDCGKSELNDYLKRFARQTQEKDGAKTYVGLKDNCVIAYYSLVVGDVEWQDCPDEIRKGLGKYPVPVLVIGRLAVDIHYQGKRLEIGMLKDAFLRALQVSEIAGEEVLRRQTVGFQANAWRSSQARFAASNHARKSRRPLRLDLRFVCVGYEGISVSDGAL